MTLGLLVRLWDLDARSLTHPEAYVPRIVFADYATYPRPRLTLRAVLSSTLDQDAHPPAYYVLMWLWTGVVGTSLYAIRLPSALIGTATIPLLYCLSRPEDGKRVALLAAALLALNGYHVLWSQQARMWVLIAFLAVASASLLRDLAREWTWRRAAWYVGLSVLGLWTEYYFWPVFVAQIVWGAAWSARRASFPRPLAVQALALTLATPVLMLFRCHSEAAQNYLSSRATGSVLNLLGFAHAFDHEVLLAGANYALVGLVILCGTVALLAGIRERVRDATGTGPPVPSDKVRPGTLVAILACGAVAATVFDLALGPFFHGGRPKLFALGLVLPWVIVAAFAVIARTWEPTARLLRTVLRFPGIGHLCGDLVVADAVLPLLLLLAISARTSVFADRALLVLAPFYLLLMARGVGPLMSSLGGRAAVWTTAILLGVASTYHYAHHTVPGSDYQTLVRAMRPLLAERDVVVIENAWWSQPVHYYLRPLAVRTVGNADALRDILNAPTHPREARRVWLVTFGSPAEIDERLAALASWVDDYGEIGRVSAPGAVAILLEPRAVPGSAAP
jgi:hypothetical protein